MVILIGGAGYAGKTLMAQNLLEKYNFPYLSLDHLKMGLYRAGIGCGFTPYNNFEYIGEKLWGILKGVIMTNIENKQNIIIEGCYILPQKIREMERGYLDEIISFYLGFSKQYVESSFNTKMLRFRNAVETRGYIEENTWESHVSDSFKIRDLCEKYKARYFEIKCDYEEEIKAVYAWLDKEVNNIRRNGK